MLGGKIDVGWLALFLLGWLTYFLQRFLSIFRNFFVQLLVTLFCLILPTNHSFGNRVFGQFFVKNWPLFVTRFGRKRCLGSSSGSVAGRVPSTSLDFFHDASTELRFFSRCKYRVKIFSAVQVPS